MASPTIRINLSVDATNTAEVLAQTAQQAKEAFEGALVTSLEKAQKKLYELNRDLQNHNAVIQSNKQAITDLEAKRASAGEAEITRINAEIKARSDLIRQRELESSKIEEKRTKQEATIKATQTASEQEKLAIQLTTQQRLIEIGVIRDSEKANQKASDAAVKASEKAQKASDAAAKASEKANQQASDAAVRASEKAQKASDAARLAAEQGAQKTGEKIKALEEKQLAYNSAIEASKAKISQLMAQHDTATNASRADIEQEIEALQRSMGVRQQGQVAIEEQINLLQRKQALSKATTDDEREQIEALHQAKAGELAATRDQINAQMKVNDTYTAATEEAIAEIEGLTGKQQQLQAVIKGDGKLIEDLQQRRAKASSDERKQIDEQIAALKRKVAEHRIEILTIEQKKVKTEEAMHIAIAGSEEERQAIRKTTQERLAVIGVQKDLVSAQSEVNSAVDSGTSAVLNYVKGWFGIQAVMTVISAVTEAIREQQKVIEDSVQSFDKMRNEVEQLHNAQTSFNTEFGLMDQKGQQHGASTLIDMSEKAAAQGLGNFKPSELGQTFAAIHPVMKQIGHGTVDDTTGQAFAMNAEALRQRGIDRSALAVLASEGGTADAMGKMGMDLLATTGSPNVANQFLDTWKLNKQKFTQVGLSFDDAQKMFMSAMTQSGSRPEEAANLITKYGQGVDRLMHLSTDKEVLDEFHSLRNLSKNEEIQFHALREMPYPKQAQWLSQHGGGTHAFDATFLSNQTGGIGLAKGLAKTMSSLSGAEQSALIQAIGPRAGISALAVGDYRNVQLQSGGALVGDTSAAAATASVTDTELMRRNASMAPQNADALRDSYAKVGDRLAGFGAKYDYRGPGGWQTSVKVMNSIASKIGPSVLPTEKELQGAYGLGSYIVKLAKQREAAAAAGAPASVIAQYDAALLSVGQQFGIDPSKPDKSGLEALVTGTNSRGSTRAAEIAKYDAEVTADKNIGEAKYLAEHIPFVNVHHGFGYQPLSDPANLDAQYQQGISAEEAERKWRRSISAPPPKPAPAPATQPATQPSMFSPGATNYPPQINYHIRQVNYGMSYDQIGAPESTFNRFG